MLNIRKITCGYNEESVLHDVSLSVNDGEFFGIIGPNGSGKTTLLRAISNIIRLKHGEMLFENVDISKMGFRELAKKVAVVPQTFELSHITVEEFVLLGRIPYFLPFQFFETNEDVNIAKRSMEMADIYHLKDKLIDEISTGERQLALIAKALTQKPKLMLLDEPTAHLDISHQVIIMDLLKRLNRELNLTVIMVLHDLNLASEYCNRLALINEGRIYKLGTPKEVLDYKVIEEVYKTVVVVEDNPVSSKPYVLIVSEEAAKKRRP